MINIIGFLVAVSVLALAIVVDLVFGDPSPRTPWRIQYKLHPTVWMGKLTSVLTSYLKNPNPKIEKLGGVLLAVIVILTFTLPAYFGLGFVYTSLGLFVYIFIAVVILKLTVCIRLETEWAVAAANAIESGDLNEARKYSHFSRRDSRDLTGPQIVSSVIESVAENLTDFRLSPVFYYALFGVAGAVAFRAINTLDGMVGFKDQEHIHIGWFSATLDTVANYIPARLTTILIVLASFILREDYKNAWTIARRDQAKVASINHGWPMAAIAGALHVRLEKLGYYAVGDEYEELSSAHILRMLKIRNVVLMLFVLLVVFPVLFSLSLFLSSIPII